VGLPAVFVAGLSAVFVADLPAFSVAGLSAFSVVDLYASTGLMETLFHSFARFVEKNINDGFFLLPLY
jgi:hypothetical protein